MMIIDDTTDYEILAIDNGFESIHSMDFASHLDSKDELRQLRQHFNIPQCTFTGGYSTIHTS